MMDVSPCSILDTHKIEGLSISQYESCGLDDDMFEV